MANASALKIPFVCLKQPVYSISPLKLINCDGGFGYGISFTSSSVLVDYADQQDAEQNSWSNVYAFTEIFATGNALLMDFIELGRKPTDGMQLKVLEALFSFMSKKKDAEQALLLPEDRKLSESEWMARITVHYLSQLAVAQNYMLDSWCKKKFTECPCSCKTSLKYGDTSIGNPHTWYGRIDVLLGNFKNLKGKNENQGPRAEVAASKVLDEEDQKDDSSDSDFFSDSSTGSSQAEVKLSPLNAYMSQLHSQTIVFSFYLKKCHPDLNIIPSMGVSKSQIQFHFYDSEKDIYLLSREMPLFYSDKTLNLTTVLATWLVVNYKYLMSGVTEKMKNEKKFGFHSFVGPKNLLLFKDEIEMGPLRGEPFKFHDVILTGKRFLPQNDVTATIDAKYARKS